MENPEIVFPKMSELIQHPPVAVAISVVTAKGDQLRLAGRTMTNHLRPGGAIIQVRPPFKRPWPVRKGETVKLRLSKRADRDPLEAPGVVSWVRDKAFMPSGLAVSFVGVTFSWDIEENALLIAALISE